MHDRHKSSILGLLTARGGSKGLPRKNILPLAGKPLLAWSIDAALKSGVVDRVILSTDDQEIASTGLQWGAEVPFMRPADLAGDGAPHIPVVLHALDWLSRNDAFIPDLVLLLQPTSPLRSADDICAAVSLYQSQRPQAVVGVCEPVHHPWLIKTMDHNGWLKDLVVKPGGYLPRQQFPAVYAVNGAIYLVETGVIRDLQTFIPPRTLPLVMTAERSVDIDTVADLEYAEYLLQKEIRSS